LQNLWIYFYLINVTYQNIVKMYENNLMQIRYQLVNFLIVLPIENHNYGMELIELVNKVVHHEIKMDNENKIIFEKIIFEAKHKIKIKIEIKI